MKTIRVTLHVTVQTDDVGLLDAIAETALRAVVDCMPKRTIIGTGYDYEYNHSRSRRGLNMTFREPVEKDE